MQEADFVVEQDYHIDRQRRLPKLLTVSGIADGLTWDGPDIRPGQTPTAELAITIGAGTAVDAEGRQIVLLDKRTINLPKEIEGAQVLYIAYHQQASEEASDMQVDGSTRIVEDPDLGFVAEAQHQPSTQIALAKLVLENTKVKELDLNIRQYSGLYLPSSAPGKNGPSLRSGGNQNPNRAILNGALEIKSTLTVAGDSTLNGNTTIAGTLSTTGANSNLTVAGTSTLNGSLTVNSTVSLKGAPTGRGLTVSASGNVGIGTTTPKIHLAIGDDDTGLNQEGDGQIAIYANNQERMRIGDGLSFRNWMALKNGTITSSGTTVNGNDTLFTTQLQVGDWIVASGQTRRITAIASNNSLTIDSAFSPALATAATFHAQSMLVRINNNGNVGIGTNPSTEKLRIQGDAAVIGNLWLGKADQGGSRLLLTSAQHTHFIRASNWWTEFVSHPNEGWKFLANSNETSSQEILRITGSGRLGIGTNDPQARLHVSRGEMRIDNGTHYVRIGMDGFGLYFYRDGSNAGVYMDDKNNWIKHSDASLKKDINSLSDILDKIKKLRPVKFAWRDCNTEDFGFVAQEVEKLFPEIVSTSNVDGIPLKGISYTHFGVLAIRAIQELSDKVQKIEGRITDL
ncbi:tail fiber domain-containing protein [Leptolyngbya sp. AN02str]|uniref:tail fiber domain-containing protein n=1 Tax=Leptolyngbya sp. AN02str TaxID=3423363 RepID=UPI003D3193FD